MPSLHRPASSLSLGVLCQLGRRTPSPPSREPPARQGGSGRPSACHMPGLLVVRSAATGLEDEREGRVPFPGREIAAPGRPRAVGSGALGTPFLRPLNAHPLDCMLEPLGPGAPGGFFSMERFLHSKCFANPSWAVDNEPQVLDFQVLRKPESLALKKKKQKSIKYGARDSRRAGPAAVQTFGPLPGVEDSLLPGLSQPSWECKGEIRGGCQRSRAAGRGGRQGPLSQPGGLHPSPRQHPVSFQQLLCLGWGREGRPQPRARRG